MFNISIRQIRADNGMKYINIRQYEMNITTNGTVMGCNDF